MPKSALPLVACLLALATAGASAQSVWKWRDASGQLHLSDTAPPPGTPAASILGRPSGPPTPGPAAAPAAPAPVASAGDSELQKKKLKADQERAEKTAADKAVADQKNAAIRADNCQRAQSQAKALASGMRVARLSASGEREYLDDNQRATELKRSQDIVAQSCGAPPTLAP